MKRAGLPEFNRKSRFFSNQDQEFALRNFSMKSASAAQPS